MSEVRDIFDDFPGAFWKATDLEGKKPRPLTITKVVRAEMNDGKHKPVLHFAEDERGLVLNVENRTVLAERFGRNPYAWAGKTVTLITRRVNGPKGPCPGIRFADVPIGDVAAEEADISELNRIKVPEGDDDGEVILESENSAPVKPVAKKRANFR